CRSSVYPAAINARVAGAPMFREDPYPAVSCAGSYPRRDWDSQTADGGQPGFCGRGTESGVDFEGARRDVGDGPAVSEGGGGLALAHPPRAEVAGLAVAEAHEVARAARPQHRRQAGDVLDAPLVVEDVEQPAVNDRLEGHAERPKV